MHTDSTYTAADNKPFFKNVFVFDKEEHFVAYHDEALCKEIFTWRRVPLSCVSVLNMPVSSPL